MPNDTEQNNEIVKNKNNKPITVTLDNVEPKVDFLDETEEPFMLTNDSGEEEEFIGIAVITYENSQYILMKPTNSLSIDSDESLEDDEAILFKIEPEDDEFDMYIAVEDDELADKVFAEYLKAVEDLDNELGTL